MISTEGSDMKNKAGESRPETVRDEERGEVAEAEAPTAEEENEGMSTILDADPLTGVQDDARDE
jgi:hypothetical protein